MKELQQRLVALRAVIHEVEEDRDVSDDDYDDLVAEWSELLAEWNNRRVSAIPIPSCCQKAKEAPAVIAIARAGWVSAAPGTSCASGGVAWHAGVHQDLFQRMLVAGIITGDWHASASFCPYCGTPLPTLRRKASVDIPTCEPGVGDDEGYCMTCKERLRDCLCMPPEYWYENAATSKEG